MATPSNLTYILQMNTIVIVLQYNFINITSTNTFFKKRATLKSIKMRMSKLFWFIFSFRSVWVKAADVNNDNDDDNNNDVNDENGDVDDRMVRLLLDNLPPAIPKSTREQNAKTRRKQKKLLFWNLIFIMKL